MTAVTYSNRPAPLQTDGVAVSLRDEADGVAFDMLANRVLVKDTVTPANDLYGAVTELVTTTRTTNAWLFNKDGLLEEVAGNLPRFDYDPVTRQPLGLLAEPTGANSALHNRDLTQAVWIKTTATALLDQVGLDGMPNTASSIEATAINATVLQTLTAGATSRFLSTYVKRLVGSGVVEMTMDGGATWTEITVPSGRFGRVSIPTQSVTNPEFGFRLTTSGDKIAVDIVQLESGFYASSPIITTTSGKTRSLETHTLLLSETPWINTAATVFIQGTSDSPVNFNASLFRISDGTIDESFIAELSTANSGTLQIRDGAVLQANISATLSVDRATTNRYVATWEANRAQCAVNDKISAEDTSLTLPTVTTMQIGGTSTSKFRGHIERLVIIPRALASAEISDIAMNGWPGAAPAVNILPNDARIIDSDNVGTLTKTDAEVSNVRPIAGDPNGYEKANPGWRRTFKTSAPYFHVHLYNTDEMLGEFAGRSLILADGVVSREAELPDALGDYVQRVDLPDAREREITILAPYGAAMTHKGLTIPSGYTISAGASRAALPLAAFCGGSRVNGYDATSANTTLSPRFTWTELLCQDKGWQQANFGAAGRELLSADGTLAGALNPDIAFLQADTNDLFDQTPLADYKVKLTDFITAFRVGAPTARLYVITSIWIPSSIDNFTIKIADYRTAAAEALTAIGDANNILVDGLTLVTNSTSSIPDGLHPNEIGSGEWATNLAAVASVA